VDVTKTLRDIMSAAPVCMAPGESAFAAAKAMQRYATGTVLVLTGGRLRGLVTDRDIAVRVLGENRDPRTTPIGDICGGELATPELTTLGPNGDLAEARRLVRDRAVRRIPVVEDGTPVGVVFAADLALEADPAPYAWPARS
jgi:CBS domain-containing protein